LNPTNAPEVRKRLQRPDALDHGLCHVDALEDGLPRPEIVFPSEIGTRLDDSNVRKVFRAICEKAELRLTRQSPSASTRIGCLISTSSSTKPPGSICSRKRLQSGCKRDERNEQRKMAAGDFLTKMVSLNFASWNQLDGWLRQIEGLRRAA